MAEQSKTLEGKGKKSMLSKAILSFLRPGVRRTALFFFIGLSLPLSYGLNTVTLRILSLIEDKKHPSAVRLLEREISKTKDRSVQGYYSLLLNQIPLNVPMRRARHEYAYTAAQYAENISSTKRMQLLIEAGDGFFKTGRLQEADISYKKAFTLAEKEKASMEIVYILYKMAWIKINEKKQLLAFRFLTQALEKGEERLTENILSDMGRLWVESQYFKNKIPFKKLEKYVSNLPAEKENFVIGGIIKGMERMEKQGIDKVFPPLSKNRPFSTRVFNEVLSRQTSIIAQPCKLLTWMKATQVVKLNRDRALSVLNSCTQTLISTKRKSRRKKSKIKTIISLYESIERKGIERWPLIRCYEFMGQKGRACNEALYQLVETVKDLSAKTGADKIKAPLTEAFRLCGQVRKEPPFLRSAAGALLSSSELMKKYKTGQGEWENTLFHLLEGKLFYPVIKTRLLTADIKWKGKDLLPLLFLSYIEDYRPDDRKKFLNRFGSKPLKPYDLDILIAGDFLTVDELQAWLPFSDIDSYKKTLPYFKKAVSGKLFSEEQREKLMEKLLKYFPSQKKDREDAAVFLVLNYLKSGRMDDIFKHWDKVAFVFNKKNFAEELFEKNLQEGKAACEGFKNSPAQKLTASSSLLNFMDQCCRLLMEKEDKPSLGLKVPSVLQSNDMAWDFVWLARVRNKTLQLEKRISRLEKNTSGMIRDLKKAISHYKKRKWRLPEVAEKVELLLKKQIELFSRELAKLADSSPHGEEYRELRKIVLKWR